MTIAEKIKFHRKSLGLTQTELGEKLGVQKNAVSKWECGRVEDIPASKIKAMAVLFNVPPSYLIDDTQNEPILSNAEQAIIKAYRSAPSDVQKIIQKILEE